MKKTYYPDWNCPECNRKDIFGSKDKCPSCGCYRSKAFKNKSENPVERKPGDWNCLTCTGMNFGTRTQCFKCGTPKVPTTTPTSDEDTKLCKICFDRELSAGIPCGHICMCYECAISTSSCPICRSEYNNNFDIKKIFLV